MDAPEITPEILAWANRAADRYALAYGDPAGEFGCMVGPALLAAARRHRPERGPFGPFARRVARSLFGQVLRRRRPPLPPTPDLAAEDRSPLAAEARMDAEVYLSRLPARRAAILRARFGVGRPAASPAEIAREFGMTSHRVTASVRESLAGLRDAG